MTEISEYQYAIAILFLRIFLGLLFLFQGYDKIFGIGTKKVGETFRFELNRTKLPDWIFPLTALYSSWVEFLGGLLLIVGLAKSYVLILLGIDLLMVSVAMGLMNPLWDLRQVFPRTLVLFVLMLVPAEFDLLSLDYLLLKL